MRQQIRNPEDLSWLLSHTHRFQSGQVADIHVHKGRLFDEGSGREVPAGTVLTVVIRYECSSPANGGPFGITRVARLTMFGVTDFSIFEQEGSDCSEMGVIHAEATGGRLRFWFDPHGELYVICDEAELEEVSMPSTGRPVPVGVTDWTFQAQAGDLPGVAWFLDHLDQAGAPCAWKAVKRTGVSHPAWRWEGHLMLVSAPEASPVGLVHVQTYGPLDGCGFGVTLRACDPHEAEAGRLLRVLADIIARHFEGTCLVGRHIMERDDWCDAQGPTPLRWWELSQGLGDGLGHGR